MFLPGELHGKRSLKGYSPWGYKESDMTERLIHTHVRAHTHTQSAFEASWLVSPIPANSEPISEHRSEGVAASPVSPMGRSTGLMSTERTEESTAQRRE